MGNIIGADLGLNGAISLLDKQNCLISCEPMPVIQVMINKKIRNQYDINKVIEIIRLWASDDKISMAGFERLRPIPKQSSQTGFSLGAGSMLFKTIFTFLKIPFMEVEPSAWQKNIFGKLGVQYNSSTTKEASIVAAKQLFPGFDFRPTERCKVYSDGMTDSALIGLHISNIINNK